MDLFSIGIRFAARRIPKPRHTPCPQVSTSRPAPIARRPAIDWLHLRRRTAWVLAIACNAVAFGLFALRASQSAAAPGFAPAGGVLYLLFMLAATVWVAGLGWALFFHRPWAPVAHVVTWLVLAIGAVAWIIPGASSMATMGVQAIAFAVALVGLPQTELRRLRGHASNPAAPLR